MHRRTAGITLLCISAFLYGIRYISAAIFGSNVSSWSEELFKIMLDSIGDGPLILSFLAFLIGLIYLIVAEFGTFLKIFIKNVVDENKND